MAEHRSRVGRIKLAQQPGNDSVHGAKVRRSLTRALEDQQLVLDEQRLSDDGTSTAGSNEFGDRGDEMDKQNDRVAHADIVAITSSLTRLGKPWDLCAN